MPRRQVAAAVAVVRAHGLLHPEPTVLSDGANTVVHLAPYDVVVKVAATTYLVQEPEVWLARELDLAARLDRTGMSVTVPSPELPARVHTHDGLAMTFWRHLPHEPGATPAAAQAGRLLTELHECSLSSTSTCRCSPRCC